MAASDEPSQLVELGKQTELRLEVHHKNSIHLTLESGSAEIFGTELRIGRRYTLSNQKLALYTWTGATLSLVGTPETMYESNETPMTTYLNVHHVLEQRRAMAHQATSTTTTDNINDAPPPSSTTSVGPRVLLVGPTDSGKSTISRLLASYAVRAGWQPALVDLDLGQGTVTLPGCVAAVALDAPIDIEQGLPLDAPLVYYYGSLTPSEGLEHYRALVERLAQGLEARAASSKLANASGVLINTMGWIEGDGFQLLLHAMDAFGVNIVLVLGQDKLYNQILSHVKQANLTNALQVVKLPVSGGVVARSPADRREARNRRVGDYFYGMQRDLEPHTTTLPLASLQVYRIGGNRAPTSALPIGAASLHDPLKVAAVPVNPELENSILAVTHAKQVDELLYSNVAGFIHVLAVDMKNQTVMVQCPNGGQFPGDLLLAGSFKILPEDVV